jgi:hypothetical protein
VTRRFSIDIDESRELGGSDHFANPQEHLIAALNACMMELPGAALAAAAQKSSWSRSMRGHGYISSVLAVCGGFEQEFALRQSATFPTITPWEAHRSQYALAA